MPDKVPTPVVGRKKKTAHSSNPPTEMSVGWVMGPMEVESVQAKDEETDDSVQVCGVDSCSLCGM